ncbi:MAG TPA: HAMP domain-containing histidine kinase [Spirochaetia bacterium]|nr:HAMP domain-containing histidine kinase [Spirochaetia bacterium]
MIEMSVYNDGIPLSAEETGMLFRKFVRLPAVVGTRIKGTGLGLFITKNIIESHGGIIRCEPGPSGNTFIFTLQRGDNAKTA